MRDIKKLGGNDSFNEYGIRKGFLQVPSYQIPGFRGKKKDTSMEKKNNEMIDKRIKWEDWKKSEGHDKYMASALSDE